MARRWHQTHIERDAEKTLCDKPRGYGSNCTTAEQATCPDCARIYWEARIPSGIALERVDMKAGEYGFNAYHSRSAYAIRVGEHVRAFVCCNAGYGKGWALYNTRVGQEGDSLLVGYVLETQGRYPREYVFTSRGQAVAAFALAHGLGKRRFSSLPELLEWRREYAQRQRERAERDAELAAEAAQDRAEMLEGLREIQALDSLSNFQRAALESALAKLERPEHE